GSGGSVGPVGPAGAPGVGGDTSRKVARGFAFLYDLFKHAVEVGEGDLGRAFQELAAERGEDIGELRDLLDEGYELSRQMLDGGVGGQ
ncbi:MAG: hypothetical protein ACTSU5_22355, partial [Promethearchaeota archaeon]